MGQIALTAASTAAVTLLVTLVLNKIINAPKKQRERREAEEKSLKAEFEKIDLSLLVIKAGLQAVLKNELKVRYFKWIDLGYAPEDAKDDLERMYTAYHNLGANGVMDKHRERFLNLPSKK